MAVETAGGLSIAAPAKVNLFLHVVGQRADGYHDLESLFIFAHLGDRLRVAEASGLALSIKGPFGAALPAGPENIVLRAAERLCHAAGRQRGARLTLEKRLPIAAGIGGGSSDAAAALRLLNRFWGLGLAPPELASIGLDLGADVPACLEGRPVFVSGIGERIAAAPPLPGFHLLLVNPGVALPTAAVFCGRSGPFSAAGEAGVALAGQAFTRLSGLVSALARCRNDLEPAAVAVVPAVAVALRSLAAAPGCLLARMSGSGATCFGVFAAAGTAHAAARAIRAAQPAWWVAVTGPRRAPPRPCQLNRGRIV